MKTIDFPNYREIDAPWDPQPVAWRFIEPDTHIQEAYPQPHNQAVDALIEQANNPLLTHLVREVTVYTDANNGALGFQRPLAEVRDDLKLVDEQFAQIEMLTDIRVAPTTWHVFADGQGYTRTLARVAIVEGEDRIWPTGHVKGDQEAIDSLTREEQDYLEGLRKGILTYEVFGEGRLLTDINTFSQYKLGSLRSDPLGQRAFFLVDIEPRLNKHHNNQ